VAQLPPVASSSSQHREIKAVAEVMRCRSGPPQDDWVLFAECLLKDRGAMASITSQHTRVVTGI